MRVWQRMDPSGFGFVTITRIDEAGNLLQWCEDQVLGWNIWRTTVQDLGWSGVREYMKERGKRFKEVQA